MPITKPNSPFTVIFDWTMKELLKTIEAHNMVYKEDSIYIGGSHRYIPEIDWYRVQEELADPDARSCEKLRIEFLNCC